MNPTTLKILEQVEENRLDTLTRKVDNLLRAFIILSETVTADRDEILTLDGMADYLDVEKRTIATYRNKYGMPSRKVGGSVLFLKSEVVEWLAKRRI